MGFIYILRNKINEKCYVGQTQQSVRERFNHHLYTCRHRNNMPISRAINKYGRDNFEMSFFYVENCNLDSVESETILLLDSINNGYNLESGGNKHKKLSGETKSKISQSLKGHGVNEVTRNKISKANKGRIQSISERENRSRTLKGRVFSDIHKEKLSLSRKGKPNGQKGLKRSYETKIKLSIAAKNRPNHNWTGLHHSENSKQKISNSLRGHVVSEETKKKISESKKGQLSYWKGKQRSKEARFKMSISAKNRKRN